MRIRFYRRCSNNYETILCMLMSVFCYFVQVDVYSLGNIFYMLLQGDWPFYDVPQETAMELVKNGTRPSVYMDVWFSTDPIDVALKEAMMMCHEQNATERASARMIEQYLLSIMKQLDYLQLAAWHLT
jgi:serine/threonine protein kinase